MRSRWTGHVLAVGSMVPKVTSVCQFRLNSSLYVSGPTGRGFALFLSVWDDARERRECVEARSELDEGYKIRSTE